MSAIFFGTFMGLLQPVLSGSPTPWGGRVLMGAISGSLFGAGMTWFISRWWEDAGGYTKARSLQTALRKRRLPDDADPQEWSALLDLQEVSIHRARWYTAILIAAAILNTVFALTRAAPELGLLPWFGVAIFAAMAIYAPFETRSRRAAVHELRKGLERSGTPGDEGASS